MSRLPILRTEDLDEDQLAVWELVSQTWGTPGRDEAGGLIGPFSAVIRAPTVAPRLLELGNALRSRTSLPIRTVELAILTVGAHWQAEFEWWMHARRARENGIPDPVIDAIGSGRVPKFDDDEDGAVHAFAHQLVQSGHVDDATYDTAQAVLGDGGLIELVSVCGYYTLVSFILNASEVPLPSGEPLQWPR